MRERTAADAPPRRSIEVHKLQMLDPERSSSLPDFLSVALLDERPEDRLAASSSQSTTYSEPESGLALATPLPLLPVLRLITRIRAWRRASRTAFVVRQTSFDRLPMPPGSPVEAAPRRGPSWPQVALTIANCLVGAGCLGLPYALRVAGWAGLLIIAGATVVTCFTAKALVECIETHW